MNKTKKKLTCKEWGYHCGIVEEYIDKDGSEETTIVCSNCGKYLGGVGDILTVLCENE